MAMSWYDVDCVESGWCHDGPGLSIWASYDYDVGLAAAHRLGQEAIELLGPRVSAGFAARWPTTSRAEFVKAVRRGQDSMPVAEVRGRDLVRAFEIGAGLRG